ncbi:CBS domain-containing protein [Magnetococcales bacterium HHB-1]
MEISDKLVSKARPFFLNFFNRLTQDLNTLTASPVSCTLQSVELAEGEDGIESFFEMDRSVAPVIEDGRQLGQLFVIFDAATSIALTGLMMMMGEEVIREQVKNREYNEEIQEGFLEVANQVVGAMNDIFEAKVDGGHLLLDLEHTQHIQYGETPATMAKDDVLLYIHSEIKIGNFDPQPAFWVLSRGVVKALFKLDLPGGEETRADAASRELDAALEGISGNEGGFQTASDADLKEISQKNRAQGPDPSKMKAEELHLGDDQAGLSEDEISERGSAAAEDSLYTPPESGSPANALAGSMPSYVYSAEDGLPMPDEPCSISSIMTETPYLLNEDEKVLKAINAMRQDGYKYFGVISKAGKLIRVVTQSDLRQIMGPFFGTKAMTQRDKAIYLLPIGKVNQDQRLIGITINGTITQAANLMMEFDLRALPVVSKQGILRGFVSVHSLLNYFRRKRQKG